MFARREAKTRIRQRDWLKLAGEKIRRQQVGSVPTFCLFARTNSPSGKRALDRELRLCQSKCTFLSDTLEFFGQVFSKHGCKPDSKRYSLLKKAPKSTNVSEVPSLLGMATYSSKYIPNFATITAPLRNLTKKNAKFKRTASKQNAYDRLTSALCWAQCMAYFSRRKEALLSTLVQLDYELNYRKYRKDVMTMRK